MLRAAKVSDEGLVETISEQPGSVIIKGRVVFNWAEVDWEESVGDLSIWSEAGGTVEVGATRYAENLVTSNPDGTAIVYTANENRAQRTRVLHQRSSNPRSFSRHGSGFGKRVSPPSVRRERPAGWVRKATGKARSSASS